MAIPQYPVLFVSSPPLVTIQLQPRDHPSLTIHAPPLQYKPVTALSGPTSPIPVHAVAQEGSGLDWECELIVVIGKRCADVTEDEALGYVLGYAVGNDVSHRDWQLKRGGGQWSLGKGFDGWAPYGPGIVSPSVIKDPNSLGIRTRLNGETMQVSVRLCAAVFSGRRCSQTPGPRFARSVVVFLNPDES